MALEPGTKLGSYEIVAPIGAGGMGEVYRARDAKLQRDVAIKVLPAELMSEPDRRARFLREARTSAAVNHPYIASTFEVGEAGGTAFIAMELVEGKSLRSLLGHGPLSIPRTLKLATEMAEGLAHAHARGVIHRDLKPDNVIVRTDGHPKILDFGLAKLLESREPGGASDSSEIRTVTKALTRAKTIMGTPAYMSPEQAQGESLDARSDVFSFGSMLYEMVAGKPPFEGRSAVEILGAIIRDKPPTPSDINGLVPPELERIIGKCLEKAADDRYQHTDDLVVDLRKIRRDTDSGIGGNLVPTSGVAAPQRAISWQSGAVPSGMAWRAIGMKIVLPIVAAALVAGSGIGWWISRTSGPASGKASNEVQSFEIDIGKALKLYDWSIVSEFALSPDGTRLAYVAQTGETSQLFVRRLDQIQATAIPGTEHALSPFFSPDGKWIAYYSADDQGGKNELKKVPVDGGPPQVLCNAWPPSGGSWLPDGTIIFSSTEPVLARPVWDGSMKWGLFQVSDSGGTPQLLTSIDRAAGGEAAHARPSALPGGRAVLFTIRRTGGAWAQPDKAGIEPDWKTTSADVALLDLSSGKYRTLIKNAHDAVYSDTGHILFMRDDNLWAAPFDLDKLDVSGAGRVVRQNLQAMTFPAMNAPYAIDAEGSAVFLPAAKVAVREDALVWVDRKGGVERAAVPPAGHIETPRVSPDGKHTLYVVQAATGDIYVHDRAKSGSSMRLTYDDTDDRRPVWLPDSRQFLYMVRTMDAKSPIGFFTKIFELRADGASRPTPWPRLSPRIVLSIPMVVLADGRTVLYQEGGTAETLWDIADSSRPWPERYIVQSPAQEEDPVLSGDGHWLAYSSLESKVRQIYVRPYPDTRSGRWQVTSDGGCQPLWAPDGSELYYRDGAAMMAVPIRTRPEFHAGTPVKLFEGDFVNEDRSRRDYDLEYPGGKRFLMIEEVEPEVHDTKFVYVRNWSEELNTLVPAGGE
ncbi:MAG TPA: protein kinase [Candidatus Saccharimonadales bacterium]|nr:protein kinase [Candidatus Saccharimonadales bacterium]